MTSLTQSKQLNIFKTQGPTFTFGEIAPPLYLHNPEKETGYGKDEHQPLDHSILQAPIENKEDWCTTQTWANTNSEPYALPGDVKAQSRDNVDDMLAANYAGFQRGPLLSVTNAFNFINAREQKRVLSVDAFPYANLH